MAIKPDKPRSSPTSGRPPLEPAAASSSNLPPAETPAADPPPPPPSATAEAPPVSRKRSVPPPLPTTATTASGMEATSLFSTLPPAEKPEGAEKKLTDSAKKRLLEAEMAEALEKDKRLAEQRRDSNTSSRAGAATASTLVSGGTAKPATPEDGIDQSRRFQDELTGENRGREQNAEVKKQRRWIALSLLALIAIFTSITLYFSRDSISAAMSGLSASSSASASVSVTASASASAKPKTSSTAKPKPAASTTPKPTAPIVTPSAPPSSCTPVTQDWVDAQPWAAGRNGNDINKFSIRNWPKSLNCGKGDTLMKWVDAKNVDISACCQ